MQAPASRCTTSICTCWAGECSAGRPGRDQGTATARLIPSKCDVPEGMSNYPGRLLLRTRQLRDIPTAAKRFHQKNACVHSSSADTDSDFFDPQVTHFAW